jgi:Zn-dependent peptidase ImmA (M78 family)
VDGSAAKSFGSVRCGEISIKATASEKAHCVCHAGASSAYFISLAEFMPSQNRQHLSRNDIDAKAEEVALHFDPHALSRTRSPMYEVINGLKDTYRVQFHFDQDLGHSAKGKKIVGRFDFGPRRIFVDRVLPYDSPRFRWTLCHELGHLVLHRELNPKLISQGTPRFIDTRTELRFIRTAQWSDLEWIEWQANQFASALLLPRPIVNTAVAAVQHELNIPRPGSIYLDEQPWNLRDYISVLRHVSNKLSVSRTVLRIRLLHLGILTDARRIAQDHIQEGLRSLFSEQDKTLMDKGE